MNKKQSLIFALFLTLTTYQLSAGTIPVFAQRKHHLAVTAIPVATVVTPYLMFNFENYPLSISQDKVDRFCCVLATLDYETLTDIHNWINGFSKLVNAKTLQVLIDNGILLQNFEGGINNHFKIVAFNFLIKREDGQFHILSAEEIINFQRAYRVFVEA